MDKRMLGKSGIAAHPLGIGCWSYGGGSYWGEQAQADVENIVAAALDRGLNFFDTAAMYNDGRSEISLGRALRGRRERAVVATKVSPADCHRAAMIASLDASLSRLGMDYVDLFMIHWPLNPISVRHFTVDPALIADPPTAAEAFATLNELKKQGKIRAIGVSNFGAKQLAEALATGVRLDVNEITYNLLSRAIEREILPFCVQNGISVISSMALQQGMLTGRFTDAASVPPPQAHSRHFDYRRGGAESRHTGPGAEEEMFAAIGGIKEISAELGVSMPQLAIAWILARPGLTGALVGSRSVEELDENIEAAELRLSPEAVARLDALTAPVLQKLGYSADYYEDGENNRIW